MPPGHSPHTLRHTQSIATAVNTGPPDSNDKTHLSSFLPSFLKNEAALGVIDPNRATQGFSPPASKHLMVTSLGSKSLKLLFKSISLSQDWPYNLYGHQVDIGLVWSLYGMLQISARLVPAGTSSISISTLLIQSHPALPPPMMKRGQP